MNKTVIVHDERLEGCVHSAGRTVFPVDESVSLKSLIANLAATCQSGGFRMIVLCHGNKRKGLQLCRENLNLTTVNLLSPLKGLFSGGVMLNACKVARVSDGQLLCSRIAEIMGASVEAPRGTQTIDLLSVNEVDFVSETRWQGRVYTWDSAGKLSGARHGGLKARQDWIEPPAGE